MLKINIYIYNSKIIYFIFLFLNNNKNPLECLWSKFYIMSNTVIFLFSLVVYYGALLQIYYSYCFIQPILTKIFKNIFINYFMPSSFIYHLFILSDFFFFFGSEGHGFVVFQAKV